MKNYLIVGAVLTACALSSNARTFEPNWESLNTRECPSWWTDAKFGIFIHWGLYSVPGYATPNAKSVYDCYAEHYSNPGRWKEGQDTLARHRKLFSGRTRVDLTDLFTCSEFKPADWAELFKASGAKYVVLTSKHHEGFALWPSTYSPYFNSVTLGPGRDICGELTKAVRGAGLHMGFYYSLLEWYHPWYNKQDINTFVDKINLPQLKELVTKYEPDIVWTDGEWGYDQKVWRGPEFLAWLYNESPVKDHVVANDRWGWVVNEQGKRVGGMRGNCGDHYTSEYSDGIMKGKDKGAKVHPWEECRGIGRSFGYNRMECATNYMTNAQCVESLVEKCSRGGNLLLNIGPTADGRIPPIMEERLRAMGAWLKVNGEAIYGTSAWEKRPDDMRTKRVYYTKKGADVYAIVFAGNREVTVKDCGAVKAVELLGGAGCRVEWRQCGEDVVFAVPSFPFGEAPCEYALAFKLSK